MLLVKPNVGLSTPQIFKALDLDGLSQEDPLALMEAIKKRGCADDVCVNDLEAPAFSELPELLELKNRLQGGGREGGEGHGGVHVGLGIDHRAGGRRRRAGVCDE
jgi:4-diphosphocytidyl-2-C-methyl-D-erythritol kinase